MRQQRFKDVTGRILFVDTGIGTKWSTYYRKGSGSLKRFVTKHLPNRDTMQDAEIDLAAWAKTHNAKPVTD
jgi:hypothetical protein